MAKGKAKAIQKVHFAVWTRKITRKTQRANAKAMRALAKEMTAVIKEDLSVQGTPKLRSAPGEPPRRQKGFLKRTTKVEFDSKNKLIVKTPLYGIYLDGGTSNMRERPFLRVNIHDMKPNWNRRYRFFMRKFSKKGA